MEAVDAVSGGEGGNGGIIFPPVQLCRDSYTGMAFRLDRTEGLKVLLKDGWIHVRASHIKPVVRAAVEARSQAGVEEWCGRVAGLAGS